jgi:hypothetical protein
VPPPWCPIANSGHFVGLASLNSIPAGGLQSTRRVESAVRLEEGVKREKRRNVDCCFSLVAVAAVENVFGSREMIRPNLQSTTKN